MFSTSLRARLQVSPIQPLAIVVLLLSISFASTGTSVAAVEKVADGIVVPVGGAFLKIQVCADDIIRVASARDRAFFSRKSSRREHEPAEKLRRFIFVPLRNLTPHQCLHWT